jgi:hypothetical protein
LKKLPRKRKFHRVVGVPPRHLRALKLMTERRKLSPDRSNTSLSRSSFHRHHPTWWT